MANLDFIQDVIYHLKMEYGEPLTLKSIVKTLDVASGEMTNGTVQQVDISLAIPLPRDRRDAFLKSIGIHKSTYVEFDQQQFLIDKLDVPAASLVGPERNQEAISRGVTLDIKLVEDYTHAYIVTTSTPR